MHGFITVPRDTVLDLIQTPEVQRLRRIRQLGVGYLVFPGAEHTRFGHALGAMALMQDAIMTIRQKGTHVSEEERTAALCAALLHDVGHGPFSHTLEHELIRDFHHEQMSRALIARMSERIGSDALSLALKMFDDSYERPFFHQLVSSQLDMDRLDYLRRDSFYTGVVEGSIGVQRIIQTMRAHPAHAPDARVVIDAKGIYAVESFLIARRLMYWQVYLHKTVVAGDEVLRSIVMRARELLKNGLTELRDITAPSFLFFLENDISSADLHRSDVVDAYANLDDSDVLFSLKQWSKCVDRPLSDLARRFTNRDFFRVLFLADTPDPIDVNRWREVVSVHLQTAGLANESNRDQIVDYYFKINHSRHEAYEVHDDSIVVLEPDGSLHELSQTTDTATVDALRRFEVKPYICYPKEVSLNLQSVRAGLKD